MKAVVLHGSPRRNGETIRITNRFMDGLRESGCDVSFVDAASSKVNPCTGCLSCENAGECVIRDDMDNIYKLIEESDIVVLSSPVYFASVTAQLKAVIDRCQRMYSKRYIHKIEDKKRKGYIIFTAGCKNERMIEALEILGKFFMLSCNGVLCESIYALGTDEISTENRVDILNKAYETGLKAGGI